MEYDWYIIHRNAMFKFNRLFKEIDKFYRYAIESLGLIKNAQYSYGDDTLDVEDIANSLDDAAHMIADESEVASEALQRIAGIYKLFANNPNATEGFNTVYGMLVGTKEIRGFKNTYPRLMDKVVYGETVEDILNSAASDINDKAKSAQVDINIPDRVEVVKALNAFTPLEETETPSPYGETPLEEGVVPTEEAPEEGSEEPSEITPDGTPEEETTPEDAEEVEQAGLTPEEKEQQQLQQEKEEISGEPSDSETQNIARALLYDGVSEDGKGKSFSVRSTHQRKDKAQEYRNKAIVLQNELARTTEPRLANKIKELIASYKEIAPDDPKAVSLLDKLQSIKDEVNQVRNNETQPFYEKIDKNEETIQGIKDLAEALKKPLSKEDEKKIATLKDENEELYNQWAIHTEYADAFNAVNERMNQIKADVRKNTVALHDNRRKIENEDLTQQLTVEEDPLKKLLLEQKIALNKSLGVEVAKDVGTHRTRFKSEIAEYKSYSHDKNKEPEQDARRKLIGLLENILSPPNTVGHVSNETPEQIQENQRLIDKLLVDIDEKAKLRISKEEKLKEEANIARQMRGDIPVGQLNPETGRRQNVIDPETGKKVSGNVAKVDYLNMNIEQYIKRFSAELLTERKTVKDALMLELSAEKDGEYKIYMDAIEKASIARDMAALERGTKALKEKVKADVQHKRPFVNYIASITSSTMLHSFKDGLKALSDMEIDAKPLEEDVAAYVNDLIKEATSLLETFRAKEPRTMRKTTGYEKIVAFFEAVILFLSKLLSAEQKQSSLN